VDLAQAAINAFAAGWALSDGPMTPGSRPGASPAVLTTALGHSDDRGVLEATLRIGNLEGT
jgi:hypothetical protein